MAEFQLDINEIEDEESALTIAEVFLDSAIDEKGLRKEFVQNFFTNALHNLESQSASPKTKFYTLFVIKELSTRDKVTLKIFGTFSQHPLYNHLEEVALTVDPKKPVSEKGKGLFPSDKQTGNNFMRLLLESLVTWGTRFPTNSKKEPTRFRRTLTRLTDEKVALPKDFLYYLPSKKTDRSETPQPDPKEASKQVSQKEAASSKGVSNENISNPSSLANNTPGAGKGLGKEKVVAEIRFMRNKIEALLSVLEESESGEEVGREVQSYHLKFEKDLERLEEIQGEMLEHTDEELVKLYFKIFEFFHEERDLYKLHAARSDYALYLNGYSLAYEKIFENRNSDLKPHNEASIDKRVDPKPDTKPKSGLPPPKPEKKGSEKSELASEKENAGRKAAEKEGKEGKEGKGRESRLADNREVEKYFSKLEQFSKSPMQGFGSVAKSLEKEKKAGAVSRLKASHAPNLNKSKFTGASSYSRSTVKLKGIFAAPPNPNLIPKAYEGELVLENEELERQGERIGKEQGVRRLKAALFKNKYVLYQDEALQIGFKSAPNYEQTDFPALLDFELFFGNKGATPITNFAVSFHNDKQSLIYTSPQVPEPTIHAQAQARLELLNVPRAPCFGLISLQASYEVGGERQSVCALLPNSVLQMAAYFEVQGERVGDIWRECLRVLKTEPFKLSHYFPPDELVHLLPRLREKGKYSRFAAEGSTVDYELFCEVVLQEKHEGVLNIVVRPDLRVVLQAALYAVDDNALLAFKFYLQSLQMALREVDN